MAKEDPRNDGPSLELPSLGFGRKRRKKAPEAATAPPPEDTPEEVPETGPAAGPPPPAEPEAEPVPVPEPVADPVAEAAPEPDPVPEAPPAPPLFVDEVASEPAAAPVGASREEREAEARSRRELPALGGMAAAVVTGLLVGIITVGLTWGSLHLCEVLRGTSSCGTPGFLLLLAIMIAMVMLGSLLLRAWGLPEPGSTSFLAVGLLAVLALLFLVDVLFSWWMIIVIPLCAVVTFTLSHWVTTAFIEPADH